MHRFDDHDDHHATVNSRQLDEIVDILDPHHYVPLSADWRNMAGEGDHLYWTLTVDDGLASDWRLAEFCDARGLKLTTFVSPQLVGRPGYLSWYEIGNLQRCGHLIGSHGLNHIRLGNLGQAELQREILESKSQLEDRLGVTVTKFAYPGGVQNWRVRRAVLQAGYFEAFSTTQCLVHEHGPRLAIPRITLQANSSRQVIMDQLKRRRLGIGEHLLREPVRLAKQTYARAKGIY